MNEYNLSANAKKILRIREKVSIGDVTLASKSRIDEYNRSEIKSRIAYRRLYKPVRRNILKRTFIIPVSETAITGYLFEKVRDKSISGQNSLIIFFHDGGWLLGNMSKCQAVCRNICNATGATVLAVDFRLAPKFKFPTPLEDCYESFLWAAQGARYWKIDPDKIYLMGACSGGNLAACVSRMARDRKGPKIAGQILISPITDGRMRTESIEKFKDSPTLNSREIAFYIQNYSREPKDILDPLFSPLLAKDHSRLPRTLILTGELDPLKDDSRLYGEALAGADTPAKCLEVKGALHGFFSYPGSTGWKNSAYAIKCFVGGQNVNGIEFLTKKEIREMRRRPKLIVQ